MGLPKRKVVFQPSIFRCYVGSQEGIYCIGSNFKGTSLKTLQLNNLKLFPIGSMYGIFPYIYHKNQPNVGKYTIHGSYGFWLKLVFESSFKRCLAHRFSMWGSTRVRTWKSRRKAFCCHGKSLRKKKLPKERNGESDTCIKNIPKLSLFCKKNSWSCVAHLVLKPKAPRLVKLSLHLRELTAGTWKYPQKSPKRKRFETSTQTSNFWVQNVSFGGCNSNMINPTNHPCGGCNQGFASTSYDHYKKRHSPRIGSACPEAVVEPGPKKRLGHENNQQPTTKSGWEKPLDGWKHVLKEKHISQPGNSAGGVGWWMKIPIILNSFYSALKDGDV